jgi:hypothetical protein
MPSPSSSLRDPPPFADSGPTGGSGSYADWKPRSAAGLLDVSFNLLRARPALLLSLGSLHLLPVALALAALATLPGRAFPLDHPSVLLLALAAFAALAAAVRPFALGSTALAVDALVRGEEPRPRDCLGAAFAHGRAVLAVAASAILLDAATLGLLRGIGAHHLKTPLVVLERRPADGARREAARLASEFTGAHATLSAHHLAIYLATVLNLRIGALLGVELGRMLLGLDLAAARAFVALENGAFWVLVAFVAWFVLEPLRAISKTMLLLDLRLREEGTDLRLRLERLDRG